jgi:phosphodiesterase/alkaline phosphatase D-like protein
LKGTAERSDARWKIVGNQLMIMPLTIGGLPITYDSWDGYGAERSELLGHLRTKQIKDVVFLTGDIHTFFAGDVRQNGQSGPPVAVEFVGGSTTSPGAAELLPNPDTTQVVTDLLPVVNPWMKYASTREHGFAMFEASPIGFTAEYWASQNILTREGSAAVSRIARMGVTPGVPHVNVA